MIPKEKTREFGDIIGRVRNRLPVDHFETTRIRKDGAVIDVSLTISPIKDRSGKVIAASTIARDVTFEKKARVEIQKARDDLKVKALGLEKKQRGHQGLVQRDRGKDRTPGIFPERDLESQRDS